MDDTASELIEAAEQGDAERVRWLLAENPGLADTRKDGMSLLLLARYRGDRATVDALRSGGKRLDIFEAATFDDDERIAELLDEDPALATAWSPDGFTALHLAAFMGGVNGARLLVDAGADLNVISRNDFHVAPIHSASAGKAEVAMLLVERGADVNVRQLRGWTPLHAAAQNGHAELVDALLAAGADADATNDDGVTATDLAVKAGHEGIARRLRAGTEAQEPQ